MHITIQYLNNIVKNNYENSFNSMLYIMRKILAIKGHPTRGKEVIELLEMLGGVNDEGHSGTNTWKDEYYFLDNGYIRAYDWSDGIKFPLEGFWMKYPFKIGDKVFLYDNITEGCVTRMKWDEDTGTIKYCVYTSSEYWCDVEELLKWNTIDLVEKHYEEQTMTKTFGNLIKGDKFFAIDDSGTELRTLKVIEKRITLTGYVYILFANHDGLIEEVRLNPNMSYMSAYDSSYERYETFAINITDLIKDMNMKVFAWRLKHKVSMDGEVKTALKKVLSTK